MPKKSKMRGRTARRPRKFELNAVEAQRASNLVRKAMLDGMASTGPILPSIEAMGLAESVLNQITANSSKKRKEQRPTQVMVAEFIEAALRVRRAAAEMNGIQKGQQEATAAAERKVIDGVIDRIAAGQRMGVKTIAFSLYEAKLLGGCALKAGFGPRQGETDAAARQGVQAQQWRIVRDSDNAKAA